MYKKECKWCKEIIEVEKQPLFALHVSNCKFNPNLEKRYKEASLRFKGILKSERIKLKKICPKCGIEFEVEATKSEIRRNKAKNFCSRKCANHRDRPDDVKKKISESIKSSEIFKINNQIAVNNRKPYSEWNVINKNPIEIRTFICLLCGKEGICKRRKDKKYHMKCWLSISGGIKKGSSRGKCGWYKGYWCDSSYELAFLIYNLENNIKIERNKEGFEYEYNGEKHLFYPDFLINGEYVEIKNFRSELTDCKIKYFPHKIDVIYKDDIKPYLNYVMSKYGKDFIRLYEDR